MAFQIVRGDRRRVMTAQGCPCGDGAGCLGRLPTVSLVMQLSTLGEKRRVRAAAVTIRMCEKCVRLIHAKQGRLARRAIRQALQLQAVELARKVKVENAA
jgi:hypothetical protein